MEPFNRESLAQVFQICSDLEELIRDTAQRRKKYPQQITDGVSNILQSRKEILVRESVSAVYQTRSLLFIILVFYCSHENVALLLCCGVITYMYICRFHCHTVCGR